MITSPQNPRVKQAVALREHRERSRSGLMLVEGYEEISLALDASGSLLRLFYCPELLRDSAEEDLATRARNRGAEILQVSERVFARLAYREGPDGWLAVFHALDTRLDRLRLDLNPLLLVAESVEKPGNLGAMLRTADAAGVDAFISADPRTDLGNPNVVRASKGALFSVPVAQAETVDVVRWLREQHVVIVVATPEAADTYHELDLSGGVAIVVGTEKEGVSASWLDNSDYRASIPMTGRVNSLNVSIAAAVLVYEAVRQRTGRAAWA